MPAIPNTTIVHNPSGTWEITPASDYAIHTNVRDYTDIDELGNETFVRGYTTGYITVEPSYDFDNTKDIDGYTAYGMFEIFARPMEEAEGQIF